METKVEFKSETKLGNIEIFKSLPIELHSYIADYTEEGYNLKCFHYNWYDIIEAFGYNYGWDYLINFLNKHLTQRIIGPLRMSHCKHMTGYCHTCYNFIKCDEKLKVGFYYDYVKMHPGKRYFWDEDLVKNEKATQLIIEKINEYIKSENYNSSSMYQINKRLLNPVE
tara:strand:- start:1017 stop:1520 length:504 start_codon:yes stop_codon:yes gene_type:complete